MQPVKYGHKLLLKKPQLAKSLCLVFKILKTHSCPCSPDTTRLAFLTLPVSCAVRHWCLRIECSYRGCQNEVSYPSSYDSPGHRNGATLCSHRALISAVKLNCLST